jgi:hypothetical protein
LISLEERNNNGSIISKKIIQDIVDLKIADFINHYNSIEEKEEKEEKDEKEDNDLELFFEIDYDLIEPDRDLVDYIHTYIDVDEKRIQIFMRIIEEAIDKICSAEGILGDAIEFITEQIGDDILYQINKEYEDGGGENPVITKEYIEGVVKPKIQEIKQHLQNSN